MDQDVSPASKKPFPAIIVFAGVIAGLCLMCCGARVVDVVRGKADGHSATHAQTSDHRELIEESVDTDHAPLVADTGVSSPRFKPLEMETPLPTPTQSPTPPDLKTEPAMKTERARDDAHAIGDTFELGKFKYTVTNRRGMEAIGKTVGGSFWGERASAGATFVVVTYRIESMSNKTETVLASDFRLVDSLGREFRPSSRAETAMSMYTDNKDLFLSEIQPGIPKTTSQAFEVPLDSVKTPGLLLIVPEKGFGGGNAKVKLN